MRFIVKNDVDIGALRLDTIKIDNRPSRIVRPVIIAERVKITAVTDENIPPSLICYLYTVDDARRERRR